MGDMAVSPSRRPLRDRDSDRRNRSPPPHHRRFSNATTLPELDDGFRAGDILELNLEDAHRDRYLGGQIRV
jgi:hypothetical protein